MTVEQILNEALPTPTSTRAFVAEKLLESLDYEEQVELWEEWLTEIRQRAAEIDKGRAEMIAAEQVFSSIRERSRA